MPDIHVFKSIGGAFFPNNDYITLFELFNSEHCASFKHDLYCHNYNNVLRLCKNITQFLIM